VPKKKRLSEKAEMKRMAKKPFGPWEKRDVALVDPMRPRGPRWREDCYVNNRYSVQLSDRETTWGPVIQLWIRRHDDKMPRSWSDLQRIKNEIIGEDRVAVEVFPENFHVHDSANMAHLWVLPKGFILPFTL
jgi:hypothetical protein